MSEPLNTGVKRIIWIASNRKHQIIGSWCRTSSIWNFKEWKAFITPQVPAFAFHNHTSCLVMYHCGDEFDPQSDKDWFCSEDCAEKEMENDKLAETDLDEIISNEVQLLTDDMED